MYLIVFSSEFMFYLCHLYLTTHNGVQQDFHIKWCAFRLKVTRHVPHMEQDLHTNTEYLSSSPIILWSVAQSLVFCVVLCIFFTFVLFLLAIVLYVLLWCMQSKYSFGIFTLFSRIYKWKSVLYYMYAKRQKLMIPVMNEWSISKW